MRILIVLVLFFLGNLSFGQITFAKTMLLELESGIQDKKFSKKWNKDKKEDWVEDVNRAKTVEDLNKAFNLYSDLYAQKTGISFGNSFAKTELEFVKYLSEVAAVIAAEQKTEWGEGYTDFKADLDNYVTAQEEQLAMAAKMEKIKVANDYNAWFKSVFPEIWKSAESEEFKEFLTGDLNAAGNTSFSKPFLVEHKIWEDKDGIRTLTLVFDGLNDEDVSYSVVKMFKKSLEKELAEEYPAKTDYNSKFTDGKAVSYEFEAEKFATTAKKPSIILGTRAGSGHIEISITEPLFGH